MTDQEFADQKARIDGFVVYWLPVLGLSGWRMDFKYFRDSGEFPGSGDVVLAETYAQWEYMQGAVSFNVPLWTDLEEDEAEETVVHELMHVLLKETRYGCPCDGEEFDTHHEERVATMLSRAFLAARSKGVGQ